jgi:hypothetical protein
VFGRGSSPPVAAQKVTYYGFYGDFQSDGTTTISDETIDIEFLGDGSNEVRAKASGQTSAQGKKIQKTWKFAGFRNSSLIVLGFATLPSKDDPNPNRIGVYELEQSDAGAYTGTAIYWDCDSHMVMQCPYALSPDSITTSEAKRRWPKLFERACVPLPLTPDKLVIAYTPRACQAEAQN